VVDGVAVSSVRLTVERPRESGGVATRSLLERAGDLRTALRQAPALFQAIGRELVADPPVASPEGARP